MHMISTARIQFPSAYLYDILMRPSVRALFIQLFFLISSGALLLFGLARILLGTNSPFVISDPYPLLGLGLAMLGLFLAAVIIEFFCRSNVETLGISIPSGGEIALRQ